MGGDNGVVLCHGPMQPLNRLFPLVFSRAACLLAQGGTAIDNDQVRVVTVTTPDGKLDVVVHKAGEAVWGGATIHKEDNPRFEAVIVEFKN